MTPIQLEPGDYVTIDKDSMLSQGIEGFTAFKDPDGHSGAGHALIIIERSGTTFEALKRYESHNFFRRYAGCKVLVGRHVDMTPERNEMGWQAIKYLRGKLYPWYRIPMFLLPYNLCSKIHFFGKPVCSELCYMHGLNAGMRRMNYIWGVPPSYLYDEIKHSDYFDVVAECTLPN